MRMWTKSACVVFALSALLILAAVGITRSDHQVQANARIASGTLATLTAAVRPAAAIVTANRPATYVVQPGDTLSAIAAQFMVRGGWPALYRANQALLGPDPNVIQAGTVLVLPDETRPVRYTVMPGDTLSGIAAALGVPGGWHALYAANHRVIGTNPGVIEPGTVLIVPRPVASATPRGRRRLGVPRSVTSPRLPVPRSPIPTNTLHAHIPVTTERPAAVGMPQWLVIMLLSVASLIGAAFLVEPFIVLARRRRKAARQPQMTGGSALQGPGHWGAIGNPRIVIADYDRLVVTQCQDDDTVYVLRPPGEDPMAVLRVARLVLRELSYQHLADHLHVPVRPRPGGSPGWGG
jgi:LysM repeat protein